MKGVLMYESPLQGSILRKDTAYPTLLPVKGTKSSRKFKGVSTG
jgi:hypothetical protein